MYACIYIYIYIYIHMHYIYTYDGLRAVVELSLLSSSLLSLVVVVL